MGPFFQRYRQRMYVYVGLDDRVVSNVGQIVAYRGPVDNVFEDNDDIDVAGALRPWSGYRTE